MTLDTAGSASVRSTRIARCHGGLPCPRASAGRWPGQRCGQGGDGEGQGADADGASVPDRERVFGCDMVRYRGLERNMQRLALLLGFSNLMIA